jgi:DNA-binding NtrC family response regulator
MLSMSQVKFEEKPEKDESVLAYYAAIASTRGFMSALDHFERDLLRMFLRENITDMAKILKMNRTTLSVKLRKRGLTSNPPFKRLRDPQAQTSPNL